VILGGWISYVTSLGQSSIFENTLASGRLTARSVIVNNRRITFTITEFLNNLTHVNILKSWFSGDEGRWVLMKESKLSNNVILLVDAELLVSDNCKGHIGEPSKRHIQIHSQTTPLSVTGRARHKSCAQSNDILQKPKIFAYFAEEEFMWSAHMATTRIGSAGSNVPFLQYVDMHAPCPHYIADYDENQTAPPLISVKVQIHRQQFLCNITACHALHLRHQIQQI
jgi:hypothetical protein